MEHINSWELPEAHRIIIDAEIARLAIAHPAASRWFLDACRSPEPITLPHEYVLPLQHAGLIEYGVGDSTDYAIHWARRVAAASRAPGETPIAISGV